MSFDSNNNRPQTRTEQQRFAQGWLAAKKRPRCGLCQLSKERFHNTDSLSESTSFHCSLGNFATIRTAICNQFQEKTHA